MPVQSFQIVLFPPMQHLNTTSLTSFTQNRVIHQFKEALKKLDLLTKKGTILLKNRTPIVVYRL